MTKEAADKAWATRRQNSLRRKLGLPPIKERRTQKTDKTSREKNPASEAAKKAWETRRQNEADEAERLEALRIIQEMIANRDKSI